MQIVPKSTVKWFLLAALLGLLSCTAQFVSAFVLGEQPDWLLALIGLAMSVMWGRFAFLTSTAHKLQTVDAVEKACEWLGTCVKWSFIASISVVVLIVLEMVLGLLEIG